MVLAGGRERIERLRTPRIFGLAGILGLAGAIGLANVSRLAGGRGSIFRSGRLAMVIASHSRHVCTVVGVRGGVLNLGCGGDVHAVRGSIG